MCFLEANRQFGWAYSFFWIVEEHVETKTLHGKVVGSFREMFRGYLVGSCTAMVRRSCLEASGGFQTSPGILEDTELFLRLAKRFPFGCVPEPLAIRTLHAANTAPARHAKYLEWLVATGRLCVQQRAQPSADRLKVAEDARGVSADYVWVRRHGW